MLLLLLLLQLLREQIDQIGIVAGHILALILSVSRLIHAGKAATNHTLIGCLLPDLLNELTLALFDLPLNVVCGLVDISVLWRSL